MLLLHFNLNFTDKFFPISFDSDSDLGNTDKAEKIKSTQFIRRHATGVAPVNVTTVALERGVSWEEAKQM